MKKIAMFTAFALVAAICGCAGCKSQKIQVINSPDVPSQQGSSGFNSESYVWEGWQFSTNRVEKK